MYATYFGLREYPFGLTSDPRFFYPAPLYQGAYISIRSAIRERQGLILLTGEPGTGKTTLLRRLSQDLEETVHIISLPFAVSTFEEILAYLYSQFSLPADAKDLFTKIASLHEYLRSWTQQGGIEVLFIDEAQSLAKETLDRLRLLLSLEGPNGKLLQIVLAGHPELESKLAQPDLRHIYQRVTVQCRLPFLPWEEVGPFIQHRLHIAGCERQDLFTLEAIQSVAHHAQAIPRLINVICDNALLKACTADCQTISAAMIEEVADNLQLPKAREDIEKKNQNYLVVLPQEAPHRLSLRKQPWARRLLWLGICAFLARLLLFNQDSNSRLARVLPEQKEAPHVEAHKTEVLPSFPFPPVPFTSSDQGREQQQTQEIPAVTSPPAPKSTQEQPPQVARENKEAHPALVLRQPLPQTPKAHSRTPQTTLKVVSHHSPEKKLKPRVAAAPPAIPPKRIAKSDQRKLAKRTQPYALASARPPLSWTQDALPPAVRATLRKIAHRRDQEHHQPAQKGLSAEQLRQREESRVQLEQQRIPISTQALLKAAAEGNVGVVTLLLTAGVSPNGKNEQGWTALMFAAQDNHLNLVQVLLARGTDVNAQNKMGETALILATLNDDPAIVEALLNSGASINATNNRGWTALTYAAWRGHRLMVEALLDRGADANLKDKEGRTASMYAAWQRSAPLDQSQLALRGISSDHLARFGRLNAERMQLMRRYDYAQIAALLQKAEEKK